MGKIRTVGTEMFEVACRDRTILAAHLTLSGLHELQRQYHNY